MAQLIGLAAAAIVAAACVAEEAPPFAMKDDAAAPPAKKDDDTSKVLYRSDFEDGLNGWWREEDEQYKPWNVVEHAKGPGAGFRGSAGAMRTTVPNTWNCLGPFVKLEYPGTDTKVTFAYRTERCGGITAQGDVPALRKKLHGTAPTFRDGEWVVETLETEKWVPWSGNETGKGQQLTSLMIYAAAAKSAREPKFALDDVVVWSGKDTTPPARVAEASGSVEAAAGEVALKWSAAADNVAVARFHVYRGLKEDFAPSVRNRVGTTGGTEFRDGSLSNYGTFYYRWVAEDASGNMGEPSRALTVVVKE